MASTGLQNGASIKTNSGWTNPNNFLTTPSLATSTADQSFVLVQFSFSIPFGSTINGFQLSEDASLAGGDGGTTLRLQLSNDGGTTLGTEYFSTLSGTTTTYSFGTPTDLGGLTGWTASIVNSLVIRAIGANGGSYGTLSGRNLKVNVFYTAPPTNGNFLAFM